MLFGLPSSDKVFMDYFDRWYEPEDRTRKIFPTTRPDVVVVDGLKGADPSAASPLTEECQSKVRDMVNGMVEAARGDWPTFLPVQDPMDIRWVDEFDKAHNKRNVKALMKISDPADFSNELLIRCCEFGSVIGSILMNSLPGLHWVYDMPYWESSIVDPKTGCVIAVYHWAIKKFSSCGIDDGFQAKIVACCQMIEKERQSLP